MFYPIIKKNERPDLARQRPFDISEPHGESEWALNTTSVVYTHIDDQKHQVSQWLIWWWYELLGVSARWFA